MHCTALRPALHPALRPVLRAALSAAFYSALCVALTRVLPCVVLPCCTVFETAGARRGVTQPVVLHVVLGGWGQRRRATQAPADVAASHPPCLSTLKYAETTTSSTFNSFLLSAFPRVRNVYPGVQGAEPPGGVQGQSPWFARRTAHFPLRFL